MNHSWACLVRDLVRQEETFCLLYDFFLGGGNHHSPLPEQPGFILVPVGPEVAYGAELNYTLTLHARYSLTLTGDDLLYWELGCPPAPFLQGKVRGSQRPCPLSILSAETDPQLAKLPGEVDFSTTEASIYLRWLRVVSKAVTVNPGKHRPQRHRAKGRQCLLAEC